MKLPSTPFMTLSEIRTMVTNFLLMDLDHYVAETPTATQLTSSVNWAIRTLSSYTWCNYDHKMVLTLTAGTAVYDCRASAVLTRKLIYPKLVTIDGSVLRSPNGYPGLWSLRDLESTHPTYQSYDNGVPARAVWLPNNKLLLSAPPDTATAAQTDHYISGVYMAASMVVTTDDANSPDIPEEGHECLAYLAAVQSALPTVTEAEGWQRVQAFNGAWREWADQEKRENTSRILGPSTIRGRRSDWLNEHTWF